MPDVALCRDYACPSRETCYRFLATPSPFMQTYASFGREEGAQKCGSYWPTTEKEAKALDRAHGD